MPGEQAHIRRRKSQQATLSGDAIIIVPCYNESDRLDTDAFVDFARNHAGIRFLFVDDGSSDETLAILTAMQTRAPHVLDVLVLEHNKGKAEAVRQGMLFAAQSGAEYVGYFDADLATPLEALVDFKRAMGLFPDIHVVFGSRQNGLGRRIFRDPLRRLISRICGRFARTVTGLSVIDTQCGAKLFTNTPVFQSAIGKEFEAGWLFDIEIFLRLAAAYGPGRQNFLEFPLIAWSEVEGSKIGTGDIIKSGFVMLRLVARRWAIRSEFKRRSDFYSTRSQPAVCFYSHFDLSDIAYLHSAIKAGETFSQIDLSNVTQVGPSVFSALIGTGAALKRHGRELSVILPDNDIICRQATRAGLVALFDCRQAPPSQAAITTDDQQSLQQAA